MSHFDPFSINKRQTRNTHIGQIIRQRPTKPNTAFSLQDFERAKKVFEAYRVPYGKSPVKLPSGQIVSSRIAYDTGPILIEANDYPYEVTLNQVWNAFKTTEAWNNYLLDVDADDKPVTAVHFDIGYPTLTMFAQENNIGTSYGSLSIDLPTKTTMGITCPCNFTSGSHPDIWTWNLTFSPYAWTDEDVYELALKYGEQETNSEYDDEASTTIELDSLSNVFQLYNEVAEIPTTEVQHSTFEPIETLIRFRGTGLSIDHMYYRILIPVNITLVAFRDN